MTAGRGDDGLNGGAGADVAYGGVHQDWLSEIDGNPVYFESNRYAPTESPAQFRDVLFGGGGDDDIESIYGPGRAIGGTGSDSCILDRRATHDGCEQLINFIAPFNSPTPPSEKAHCFGSSATLLGTSGQDIIESGSAADVIHSRGGDDMITTFFDYYTQENADIACGGKGSDYVWSGAARDYLSGGPGDDSMHGSLGGDVVEGNGGDDWVTDERRDFEDKYFLGGGADRVAIQGGHDLVIGGSGADRITDYSCEPTSLFGGHGNDILNSFVWHVFANAERCEDPDDDVIGGPGIDQAEVNEGDNVVGVEEVTVGVPPPPDQP